MDFLEVLECLMEQRHLNRRQLSINSGVPYSTIDNFWKSSYENVRLSTLTKIATYLDVSIDYLIGRSRLQHIPTPKAKFDRHSTFENDALEFGPIILKPLREQHNVTAKALGDAVGLTESDIYGIEDGSIPLDYNLASTIAQYYQSNIAQLLYKFNRYNETASEEKNNPPIAQSNGGFDGGKTALGYAHNSDSVSDSIHCITENQIQDIERIVNILNVDIKSLGYERAALARMMLNSILGNPLERGVPIYSTTSSELIDNKGEIRGTRDYVKPESNDCEEADFAIRIDASFYTPIFNEGDVILVHRQNAIAKGDEGVFIADGRLYVEKSLGKEQYRSLLEQDIDYRSVLGDDVVDEMIRNSVCFGRIIRVIKQN